MFLALALPLRTSLPKTPWIVVTTWLSRRPPYRCQWHGGWWGSPRVMARDFRPGLSPRIWNPSHGAMVSQNWSIFSQWKGRGIGCIGVNRNPPCWEKPTSCSFSILCFSGGGPVLSVFRDIWMKSSENLGSTWSGPRRFIPWTSHTWALLAPRTERVS